MFEGASSIEDADARADFLDLTCHGQPELRRRIERLLSLRLSAERFFEVPAAETEDEADDLKGHVASSALAVRSDGEEMDTRIGRYRLLDRLGEGGCGIVYLAEQMEPVRRRVALKIIRLGMDTENVIARFELERQALAMMDHPNIARVYDAGTTSSGRPFFVMQWVEGDKISDYCDKKRLKIRERVELFTRVCHAIQHAHQKGVIHRDIKPSNIIVTEIDGIAVPKVIDFGVAKATSENPAKGETFTHAGQFIGTPAYMSPEQSMGGGMDVDTRCDVYALGALLYELLAGQPAFDPTRFQSNDVINTRRILCEEEPRLPSALVALCSLDRLLQVADARACDAQKLVPTLRGDLDRIVMMAMEKDRQRRYGSADAMAADLVRYLHDEPVMARPSNRMYRLRRLVRRNKVVFAAGAMVLATLIVGFAISTRMFLREKQAREEQERLRDQAEAARSVEMQLRGQAEAREICAQAAVQLSYDKIEQADQLLVSIPLDRVPSSLEAAAAYRTVGEWHRKAGRMQQAAERFTGLAASISEIDRSDLYKVSTHFLPAAVFTCEVDDMANYERVRRLALIRFGTTKDPCVAEQILKAITLRSADSATMEEISHLAGFLLDSIGLEGDKIADQETCAWGCYSLALWYYRLGDSAKCIRWCELSQRRGMLSAPRAACVQFLLAMSHQQLGKKKDAQNFLDIADKALTERKQSADGIYFGDNPVWVDWVNANILSREAKLMICP
ncbi:MAG: serine/threonine protein kinase [Verrucomicrobia bacterium]|nr:MAG: serine/threonine protein kinase [Verrucomicrobiota bacterium]